MTDSDGGWLVPAETFQLETVVKKSRFIARVEPVADRAAVKAGVARARADYPDARHHCWAYVLGRPGDAAGAGMSDDGEPAGTAGRQTAAAEVRPQCPQFQATGSAALPRFQKWRSKVVSLFSP